MLNIFALMVGDVYIANNSQLCFAKSQNLLYWGPRTGSYLEYNLAAVCRTTCINMFSSHRLIFERLVPWRIVPALCDVNQMCVAMPVMWHGVRIVSRHRR